MKHEAVSSYRQIVVSHKYKVGFSPRKILVHPHSSNLSILLK